MNRGTAGAILSALIALGICVDASAAGLPQSTQKALNELKLDPKLMDGLDAELDVPRAWLDAANKEREVVVTGTWKPGEFQAMTAPFKERYPGINLRYERAGTAGRGTQVLIALSEGKVIADVVTGFGDAMFEFMEMKALADLRNLPGYKNIAKEQVAADGTWISHKLSFRCMAYNTGKVKKEDLPKTWSDLLQNPAWRGGKLALTDNPGTWLLGLWVKNGDKWGADFTRDLFEKVQPQRRKEGLTAATGLTVAGEFYASLPAPEWVAKEYAMKGAPLGYHCPSPVPVTVSQIGILDRSPHKNAARVFVNWMVSREAQVLQYAKTLAVPVHKALQLPRFVPFADTIVGKPAIVRDDAMVTSDTYKKMTALWDGYWTGAPGAR